MITGLLNINKPKGITSHDVVLAVRRITGEKKIGHTGTLDPNATGVLLLCLGKATKLSRKFTGEKKTYLALMRLGIRTDTHDGEGKIISKTPSFDVAADRIHEVLKRYTGEIEQIPPMYSAVKYKGKPLYRLARQGITVKREPKRVHIYRLEFKKFDGEYFEFEAETSAGVYIRTLCDEIGKDLGCGGYLAELQRTQVGNFSVDDAVSLDGLREIVEADRLDRILISVTI